MSQTNMEKIFEVGIVPLIVLEDVNDAVPLAKALVAGGIPIAEVTLRTKAGIEVISVMDKEVPEILVGAGTVHTVAEAQAAVEAGAKFIVTPGFQPDVVSWCVEQKIDIVPGTVSPSDIETAMTYGLTVCKFFPAEAYGGVATLKALAGPYAGIKFMPTGGVSQKNMREYLDLPNVAAIGGSFMVPTDLVKQKRWDEITGLCQQAMKTLLGFELGHVGMNVENEQAANQIANTLGSLFLQDIKETPGAYFAGGIAEVLKSAYLGTKGHLCIDTVDISRALAFLRGQGIKMNEETAVYDENGMLSAIYLQEEIGGFAVHLRRKTK